jgi:Rrf2 family protein
MELSNKTEYALLAMLELTAHYSAGEPLQIRQIAALQNIPDRYLEQLLAELRRCSLIRSERGAKGGYLLARDPRKITVLDVVTCMEGTSAQATDKATGSEADSRAAILEFWQEAKQSANAVLQNYTLQDLLEKIESRKQLSTMYYI